MPETKLKERLERELGHEYGPDLSLPRQFDPVGRKVQVEFWCSTCRHYLYITMNTTLNGNHIMVCPCGHRHYRLVQDGIITSERFNEGLVIADEIVPMSSARVPESQRRQRGEMAVLREMEAVGLLR
jgi:hypothetical protein